MPKPISRDDTPPNLLPFKKHGVDIHHKKGERNAIADCPFCGKIGKFTVNVETSQWRCFSCNEGIEKKDENGHVRPIKGGNSVEFLQILWNYCDKEITDYSELAKDRGLMSPEVFVRWGVVKNYLTGEWLVPAYNLKGGLIQ